MDLCCMTLPANSGHIEVETDNYIRIKAINSGTWGLVYEAVNKSTRQSVAIKELKIEEYGRIDLDSNLKEVELLKRVEHENVVNFIEECHCTSYATPTRSLVFELCSTDLHKEIRRLPNTKNYICYESST